jgi:hypothetical protein
MQDELDLYSVWQVVHKTYPKLPEGPELRPRWLLLLAHGHLDGDEHPDQLEAMVLLLWGALQVSPSACAMLSSLFATEKLSFCILARTWF